VAIKVITDVMTVSNPSCDDGVLADGRMIVTSPVDPVFLILPYLIKAADVGDHSVLLLVFF